MGTPVKTLSSELIDEMISLYKQGYSYRRISALFMERGDDYGPAVIARSMREHAPYLIARGGRKKFGPQDEKRIRQYFADGFTANQIAQLEGVAFDTVKSILDSDFVNRRSEKASQRRINCPDVELLREMSNSPEFGLDDIADKFNVNPRSGIINRWQKEHHIVPIRKQPPPRINKEAYSKLKNRIWMLDSYAKYGTVGVASILGVADGTVGRYLELHGIPRDKIFSCSRSKAEEEIAELIGTFFEIETNVRKIISPLELDIYIPEKQIAFEFNGLRWHNEENKGQTYHYDKWLACRSKGVQLFQIWEDDWEFRKGIVISTILYKLGLQNEKIGARKCELVILGSQNSNSFLETYHIQGAAPRSSVRLGLLFDDEIVACMTFHKSNDAYILSRYATSRNVQGGFTKLLTYFENTFSPNKVVTFADLCISDGGLYVNNGFTFDTLIPPDYCYVVGKKRIHKFNYRKARFKNDPDLKFEEGLSERQLARLNRLSRIYDAGKYRYVKTYD